VNAWEVGGADGDEAAVTAAVNRSSADDLGLGLMTSRVETVYPVHGLDNFIDIQ